MIAASPYARGTPALGRTGIARLSSVSTRPLCYGSMVGRCRAARLPRRDGIYSPAGGSCRLSRPGATARIRTAIGAVPMRCTVLVLRRRGGRRRHRTFIAGAIRRVSNPLPEPTGAPSIVADSGDPASQAFRLQPDSSRRRHVCPLHSPKNGGWRRCRTPHVAVPAVFKAASRAVASPSVPARQGSAP